MRNAASHYLFGSELRTSSTLSLVGTVGFVTVICSAICSMSIRQAIEEAHGWGYTSYAFGMLFVAAGALVIALPSLRELCRRTWRTESPPGVRTSAALLTGTVVLGTAVGLSVLWNMPDDGAFADAVRARMKGGYTTGQRVAQLESSGMTSMQAEMEQAGVAFPPQRLLLVVFKDARKLQIFGPTSKGWALACTMPILGASGGPGPKLREGDLQVPEGLYQIESLNPNSAHHLALRLNYPNPFDRHCAQLDGRTQLGGDIMIHGGSQSIGCLAVGDPAIERLFALSHLVGIANINVLIVPCDLRRCEPSASDMSPSCLDDLYSKLRQELAKLPTSEP